MHAMQLLLMYSNFAPSPRHLARLRVLNPDGTVIVASSEDEAKRHAQDVEVILGHRYLRQTLPYVRKLEWIQSTAAGIAHLLSRELIEISPRLTRCPVHADAVAQHAIAMLLAVVRDVPALVHNQANRNWNRSLDLLPFPRAAVVVGLGLIGSRIARLAKGLGLKVSGVARRDRPDLADVCEEILRPDRWREVLPSIDVCLMALPLTRQTFRFLDADALAALPDHAVVINVGRGATIDTATLVRRLSAGRLGGAGLDVFETEPLPPDDPLWATPRLLVSPKIAALHPGMQRDVERFIEEQVQRHMEDRPLLYEVERALIRDSWIPDRKAAS